MFDVSQAGSLLGNLTAVALVVYAPETSNVRTVRFTGCSLMAQNAEEKYPLRTTIEGR